MTKPRALDIWLTASGTLAQAKTDFNAIGLGVNHGQVPGKLAVYEGSFPDILYRFLSVLTVREAWRLIRHHQAHGVRYPSKPARLMSNGSADRMLN